MEVIDFKQLLGCSFTTTTKVVKRYLGDGATTLDFVRTYHFKEIDKTVIFTYQWGKDEFLVQPVNFQIVSDSCYTEFELFISFFYVSDLYPSDIDYFMEHRSKENLSELLSLVGFRAESCLSDYMYCFTDE